MLEKQASNIIPGKTYVFILERYGEDQRFKGRLLGTSQPALFCPVFFDVILDDDPGCITSFLVSSVKEIKQAYNKKKFKHSFAFIVTQWKEFFEENDILEFYEKTLHEFKISEDVLLTITDIKTQKKIIQDFLISKEVYEKNKMTLE